jgi:hypothetical protein
MKSSKQRKESSRKPIFRDGTSKRVDIKRIEYIYR